MEQLTFWSEEHHVSLFRSQDCGKDSKTQEAISCLHFLQSLQVQDLDGSFGKMCLESCPVTEEKILLPSSRRWGNWGMGGLTGSWTLNGSEHTDTQEPSRNAEGVCSLSDVLEISQVPQKYYLSHKACKGILRRAERRGKVLPPMLKAALEQASSQATT